MAKDTFKLPELETSTDRLEHMARLLRNDSDRWNQRSWVGPDFIDAGVMEEPEDTAVLRAATTHTCGSYGCLAGMGVAMTSTDTILESELIQIGGLDWDSAGRVAYDLDESTAHALFYGTLFSGVAKDISAPIAADLLDALASVPDHERRDMDLSALVRFAVQVARRLEAAS